MHRVSAPRAARSTRGPVDGRMKTLLLAGLSRRQFGLTGLAFLALLAWSGPAATAESPEEILRAVDNIRAPGPTFTFDLKLTYLRPRRAAVIQKFDVAVKEATKSLVRFNAPEEIRGRAMLMVGRDMWMYVPTVNQPIRISAQQRLLGPVSNADVARVIYSYDYSAKLLGTEDVEQAHCDKLELTAKTPDAAYGRIILWSEARSHRPLQAQFYATTGKQLKTAFYKDYQSSQGKERPMLVEIRDEIRSGESSRLEYSNFRLANTPDSYFTKDNLRNVR